MTYKIDNSNFSFTGASEIKISKELSEIALKNLSEITDKEILKDLEEQKEFLIEKLNELMPELEKNFIGQIHLAMVKVKSEYEDQIKTSKEENKLKSCETTGAYINKITDFHWDELIKMLKNYTFHKRVKDGNKKYDVEFYTQDETFAQGGIIVNFETNTVNLTVLDKTTSTPQRLSFNIYETKFLIEEIIKIETLSEFQWSALDFAVTVWLGKKTGPGNRSWGTLTKDETLNSKIYKNVDSNIIYMYVNVNGDSPHGAYSSYNYLGSFKFKNLDFLITGQEAEVIDDN